MNTKKDRKRTKFYNRCLIKTYKKKNGKIYEFDFVITKQLTNKVVVRYC